MTAPADTTSFVPLYSWDDKMDWKEEPPRLLGSMLIPAYASAISRAFQQASRWLSSPGSCVLAAMRSAYKINCPDTSLSDGEIDAKVIQRLSSVQVLIVELPHALLKRGPPESLLASYGSRNIDSIWVFHHVGYWRKSAC